MAKGIFVTGTDTGVGKTLIAAGLACKLSQQGKKVAVMKPVQTGGVSKEGGLVSEDLELLLAGINLDEPVELLNPYCLPEPCSPHLAARLAEVEINPSNIIDAYNKVSTKYEVVIVEGAGGLLVPIKHDYLMADLAKDLSLPLLIVANNQLGVINHTALTIECAKARELDVLGVVFNHAWDLPPSPIQLDNPDIIAKITKVQLLEIIPYYKEMDKYKLVHKIARHFSNIDWA